MTAFIKENFMWDGMYLMYAGEQGEYTKYYGEGGAKCHPTRLGTAKEMFIARFKYGNYKPYKAWINFICKNFTVEEMAGMYASDDRNINSPVGAMKYKGYKGKI